MLSEEERTKIGIELLNQLEAMLEAHGYFIDCEPVDGLEDVFVKELYKAKNKIENVAYDIRLQYNYRGLSQTLLRELHIILPVPSFNVGSKLIGEIEAEERRRSNREENAKW